jgi:phosphonate transport system permease protein
VSRLAPQSSFTKSAPETNNSMAPARRQWARLGLTLPWILAGAFLVFSLLQLQVAPERLLQLGERLRFILGVMFPPVVEEPFHVARAAMESVQVAIVGTVFGIVLSLVLGVLAAKNVSPIGPFSWLVKGFAGFVRAVPALVWALLFIVAVGLGPTPGILALAVNSTGMLVKVYAETIEEIPMGPIEALRASGASPLQVAFQGILPSVVGVFIAWSVFRFDINVRYASVLGVVGAGGIGWELVRAAQVGRYDIAMGVTLVIFGLVMVTELLSDRLQRHADRATFKATL